VFDISFFELLVIGIVGLIVIGPERLPGTIRTCALWIGRIKRNLLETRRELEKQIGADEIRRELHNEQVLHNLEKMKDTRLELEEKIRKLSSGEFLDDNDSRATPPTAEEALPAATAPTAQPATIGSAPASETQEAHPHSADNPPKH
jgi:sec-independent protein translocase protein TatB